MTRPVSKWSNLDLQLMRLVVKAWDEMQSPPSLREISRTIGVSAPRLMDLQDGKHGKPTVDEFCAFARAVNLEPAATLTKALQLVEQQTV